MALDPRESDKYFPQAETKGDFQKLLDHVQDNPLLYILSVAFIVLCAVLGSAYRVYSNQQRAAVGAEYAQAIEAETPAERAEALTPIAEGNSYISPEALYLKGESAFNAKEFEEAKAAFEALRERYPDYEFTPDAVEGLGYVAEHEDNFEQAIGYYREVQEKWPGSFASRRQPYNVGRAHERNGKYTEAIAAYREQLDVFPGSNVANHAQAALDSMRASLPHLFEEGLSESPVALPELSVGETTPEEAPVTPAEEGGLDLTLPEFELPPTPETQRTSPADEALTPPVEESPAEASPTPSEAAPAPPGEDTAPADAAPSEPTPEAPSDGPEEQTSPSDETP